MANLAKETRSCDLHRIANCVDCFGPGALTSKEVTTLLDCPFCGGPAETDSQQPYCGLDGHLGQQAAIYCTGSCSATMTLCKADVPELSHEERLAVLVQNWNRRCASSAHETSDDPSPLQTERDVYCLALSQLVRTLDAVHADSRYKAVWESYMIHGGRYTEPTYTTELENARRLLIHYAAEEPTESFPFHHEDPDIQSLMQWTAYIASSRKTEARDGEEFLAVLARLEARLSPLETTARLPPREFNIESHSGLYAEPEKTECQHEWVTAVADPDVGRCKKCLAKMPSENGKGESE